jgi:deoxyribodipyrimidine photo-lyase
VEWLEPGEAAASAALEAFVAERLWGYAQRRNDPNAAGQSDLSPYLHFGQLSAQRVALAVSAAPAPDRDREAFLEELIVRRELADNWCLHNEHYDTPAGFPAWSRETLLLHQPDPRPYLYDRGELEAARTHDPLWNAAQNEMVRRGKMHGYLRMYWAKKILEWSPDAAEAMATAIYLNDRYELDGRDPNGYAGIAWSIGGVHDRPWFSRAIFGKVRYMSLSGARRRFDVGAYVARWSRATGENASVWLDNQGI